MQLTLMQALERRGWTLDEVGRRAGVNKSTVSRINRGIVRPTHHTVVALERALRLRPGTLVFPTHGRRADHAGGHRAARARGARQAAGERRRDEVDKAIAHV
jgi:transcriptional regulator with XRE-family HTH domain